MAAVEAQRRWSASHRNRERGREIIQHYDYDYADRIYGSSQPTRCPSDSMSSGEASRRDSGISADSNPRRRPKTARAVSKQSIDSGYADSYANSSTSSHRQRPRNRRSATVGTQQRPQASIDEALELHARSCRLFSAPPRPFLPHHPFSHQLPLEAQKRPHHPATHRAQTFVQYETDPQSTSPYTYDSDMLSSSEDQQDEYEPVPATTMHWTSDDARRREYAAIDRSNSGVRGLINKVLPKWAKKGQVKFYEEEDGSDAGSVRRIRLDVT